MKRLLSLLLCLCLVLPLMGAFPTAVSASATPTGDTTVLSVGKTVFAPGEAITASAAYTVKNCWIGIIPADENGDPIRSQGTIYWKYVPEDGFTNVAFSTSDNPISGNKATKLADLMGVTVEEMLALPTGDYFMVHINSGDGIGTAHSKDPSLITYVPFKISQFSVEKTSFLYGEEIPVKALYKNTTKGYIGISHVKDDGTFGQNLYYTYITDANVGTTIDAAKGVLYGSDAAKYGRLPAGRYVLYFVENGSKGVGSRDTRSEVYFDVLGATVEKTEFAYGEPIMVTGYGSGKDWIGIAILDSSNGTGYRYSGSIRWRYIEHQTTRADESGFGSGVAFDIRESKLAAVAAEAGDLPPGEYVLIVGLDDCAATGVSPYTYIPITISAEAPAKPASVVYDLTSEKTGLAGGTLTVTFNDSDMELSKKPSKVELYWADENGNALGGYNAIGSRFITGATTAIEMTESLVIPEEAKMLMVRAYNGAGSAEAVGVALPESRSYRDMGDKVTSFQIVSDMHIGANQQSITHANLMFADIIANDPDSVGIFVAGDAADHGQVAEYEELFRLWETANENGLSAPLYIGVGNHEMMKNTSGHGYNNDYTVQIERFLSYANLNLSASEQTDTPYYYVNRGGQHFIFLATEYCGTHAYLSDAQLAWLEDTLEEVASDGDPVFILLHQPMYNTVAGSLANEDGSKRQGWDGVIAGDDNFAAWLELTAANGKGASDHSLMYGQYEAPLREILAKYPSAMMFGGHSHWIMESIGNIHEASDTQPNYLLNTASVSYLWTDNDELHGGYDPGAGSQGYYVTVYENCIEFRGRDFRNGEWISNAYYRIWLDCAHESDLPCGTVCKWCGEAFTPAVPCAGEFDCSDTCAVCGEAITPLKSCEGQFDCSDSCIYCGEAIAPLKSCEGETPTSDTCQYCGKEITPAKSHTAEYECSTTCKDCGEAIIPLKPHAGQFACSETCKVCGTAIAPEKSCAGQFDCSDSCIYCGEAITPEAPCTGEYDCSTACKICGEAITPATVHAGEYACSEACKVCGAAITPKAHSYETCKTVDSKTHTKVCVCGDTVTEEHNWVEAKVETKPSVSVDPGTKFYVCPDCSAKKGVVTVGGEEETTESETTTSEPETTTSEPETTTSEPETATSEPEATTSEPEATVEPDVTTEKPTDPESPAVTTQSGSVTEAPEADGGCGSVIGGSLIALLMLPVLFSISLLKKRDEQ